MSLSDVTKSVVDRLDTYRYNMPYSSTRHTKAKKGFGKTLSGGANNKTDKYDGPHGEDKKPVDDLSQDDEACCAICLDNYETGEVR